MVTKDVKAEACSYRSLSQSLILVRAVTSFMLQSDCLSSPQASQWSRALLKSIDVHREHQWTSDCHLSGVWLIKTFSNNAQFIRSRLMDWNAGYNYAGPLTPNNSISAKLDL